MTAPVLLGPDGAPLSVAQRRASAFGSYGVGRAYRGASLTDPDLATWTHSNPAPQVAHAADSRILSARIHDLARNDGWASGGVARIVDSVVGANWRLASKPNARALGIDADAASEFADALEAKWREWADNIDFCCDAGGRFTFGGLLALAFRHRCWDGEALAAIDWRPSGYAYATCINVIHPDRLSNPNDTPDAYHLRGGVELDDHGAPVAYHIRGAHPGEAYFANLKLWTWERVERRTPWGRARVVHAFEPQAAGQFRGVSPLAPILKKIRMLGRYDEVELQAAILNAVLAAFITSPYDGNQIAQAMSGDDGELTKYQESRLDWHDKAPISLPGVKVNFLATGEDVKLTSPNHPNSVFEAFERTVLRNIATAIGVSYEQLSMDWSQVNYSSARAGLLEIWRGFTARKDNFASQFVQPIYAAVVEEMLDRGDIRLPKGAPSFYEAKTAWCSAKWIGPARGWVDPQKEALAAIARIEGGLSTLEDEAAEQGKDWVELLQQQARENRMREELGLASPMLTQAMVKATQMTEEEPAKADPAKKKKSAR
jgi:lambda family phage portal protein